MNPLALLKRVLPPRVKLRVRKLIKFVKYRYRRIIIFYPVWRGKNLKVILGAAETFQDGWYSTNELWLDITNPEHWKNVFHGKVIITRAVAEHVFEHLTARECGAALENIYRHMVSGGRLRIAVPDGYHPNKEYLRHICVGGIGNDADDHKQLLNADTLTALFTAAGFAARHIEGYDSSGRLIQEPYAAEDGWIRRSRARGEDGKRESWGFPDAGTSLIIDGLKT